MALLQRSDLAYQYKWTHEKQDNPHIVGFPDNKLLDRNEGYEVLPYINKFAEKYKLTTKALGRKVEIMIHDNLPGSIRGQAHIEQWLVANWANH